MALVINYSTLTEVQSGTIEVSINFTSNIDSSALFVPLDTNQISGGNFELIDLDGNTLSTDLYSISMSDLKPNDYRLLVITISGKGSFRIRTKSDFQLIGHKNEHPTITSSGGESLETPQTSGPIHYDNTDPKTTDTPPSSPSEIDPSGDPEIEEEPPDGLGPEQTQFLGALTTSGDSEVAGEPQLPTLGIPLNATISYSFPEPNVILIEYTWYYKNIMFPVYWGGPTTVAIGIINRRPKIFPHTPSTPPASVKFTQRVEIPLQSAGEIEILIDANSARVPVLVDEEGVPITGPSTTVRFIINYSNLHEDAIPPTLDIIKPAQAEISGASVTIRFDWSEPMELFRNNYIIVSAQNLAGQDVTLTKSSVFQTSPTRYEMSLTFPLDPLGFEGASSTIEQGLATVHVKARAGNDLQGLRGPAEPEEMSFLYDLTQVPPGTEVVSETGNESLECTISYPWSENPFLDKSFDGLGGGSHISSGFIGVSDLTLIKKNNKTYLYGVMQLARARTRRIRRRRLLRRDQTIDRQDLTGTAGGALFQIDLSNQPHCKPEVVKAYPLYATAARSLVEFENYNERTGKYDDNRLYFYEGSHYNQAFDITTFSDEKYDWRHQVGRLRDFDPGNPNINDRDPTTDHGLVWKIAGEVDFSRVTSHENLSIDERLHEEKVFPRHKATSAPMRVIGKKEGYSGDLYLYSGFGNLAYASDYKYEPYNVQLTSNPSTVLDNWILLKYGQYLEYRLPVLLTNGKKGYDILNELAKITGSYVGAYGSEIFYLPKFPRKAQLEVSFSKEASEIIYGKNSREFPDSGLLLIETIKDGGFDQEIIRYNTHDRINSIFSDLTRAQHMTEKKIFCPSTNPIDIYYVDYVLDMDANYFIRPINDMNYRTDFNQLYNQFTLRHSTQNPPPNEEAIEHYIENKESVTLNGGKELEIEVPELDERYITWVEWLGDFYLEFYSDLHYLTNLTVVSSFHFKPGDLVLLRESKLSQINQYRKLQVINIAQNKENNTTQLQLRTLTSTSHNPEGIALASAPSFTHFAHTKLTIDEDYDETIPIFRNLDQDSTITSKVIQSSLPSNELPDGISLDGPRLHGTPTEPAEFTIEFKTSTSRGPILRKINFRVEPSDQTPSFNTFTATSLTEDQSYDQTIMATGTRPLTITSAVTTGTLPDGMTLADARLHGTPTNIPVGGSTFAVTYTATNLGGADTEVVSFTVAERPSSGMAPSFNAFTMTNLVEGQTYDQTISATGTQPLTITSTVTTGTLPTGLTLAGARLHGTPTGIPDGGSTFVVTFTATNSISAPTIAITFTVANAGSVPPSGNARWGTGRWGTFTWEP